VRLAAFGLFALLAPAELSISRAGALHESSVRRFVDVVLAGNTSR
jgi:hypothetical protein